MSDDKKTVRSIRADEGTFSRFKAVCEENGGQQEALNALLNAYELQEAKNVLTGQATSIDDFTSRVDGIVKAYIAALELSVNAEERIRAEFSIQIDSQAKTIADLQDRLEKQKTAYDVLKSDTDIRINEIRTQSDETITKLTAELDNAKAMLSAAQERTVVNADAKDQAERIACMASEQTENLKIQISELKQKADESDAYKAELEQMKNDLSEAKNQLATTKADYEKQIEILRSEQEIAVKTAIADTKLTYQDRIDELQKQQAEQIKALSQIFAVRKDVVDE